MPELSELDKTKNNVIIFDDIILDKKGIKNVEQYFIMGRNLGIKAMIYITQNYYRCPRLVRENCNLISFFKKMSDRSITMIYNDLGLDITKKNFIKIFSDNLVNKHDFVTFDIDNDDDNYKIRNSKFMPTGNSFISK